MRYWLHLEVQLVVSMAKLAGCGAHLFDWDS